MYAFAVFVIFLLDYGIGSKEAYLNDLNILDPVILSHPCAIVA